MVYDRAVRGNAKIDLLKRAPLFSGCSKAELAELALGADELAVREGETLTREGDRGREFFVLVSGSVDVSKDGKTITELGEGDWFGEIALLAGLPRTATVTASTPVRVLVLTSRAFERAVETMPSIALSVLASVAERLGDNAR